MRRKVPFLPNLITAFGLSCGLFLIFRTSILPAEQLDEKLMVSLACILLLAAVADTLDGAVARVMKMESPFGGHFDSLADAITFGVTPPLLAVKSISLPLESPLVFLLIGAAMIYSLCGVLRLIRFNLKDEEITEETCSHTSFIGLPIPAAAAAVTGLNLFLFSEDLQTFLPLSPLVRAYVLCFTMMFVGYLMLCRLKFPSVKSLRMPVASFPVLFTLVLGTALTLYGLVNHFPLILFIVSWSYVLLSLAFSLFSRSRN